MSKTNTKTAEVQTEGKTEVKTEVAPAKKQEKKNLMYLGPSITGVIRHAEVYAGGIPEAAKACVSQLPVMERLFVSLDDAADAVKELRKEESALGAIYAQVEQNFSRR